MTRNRNPAHEKSSQAPVCKHMFRTYSGCPWSNDQVYPTMWPIISNQQFNKYIYQRPFTNCSAVQSKVRIVTSAHIFGVQSQIWKSSIRKTNVFLISERSSSILPMNPEETFEMLYKSLVLVILMFNKSWWSPKNPVKGFEDSVSRWFWDLKKKEYFSSKSPWNTHVILNEAYQSLERFFEKSNQNYFQRANKTLFSKPKKTDVA